MTLLRRILIALALALLGFAPPVRAADSWDDVVHAAQGKKVYWNAWAGDPSVNAYIAWAADEVRRRFGIELIHVKLGDTAEAVSRVLAETADAESWIETLPRRGYRYVGPAVVTNVPDASAAARAASAPTLPKNALRRRSAVLEPERRS